MTFGFKYEQTDKRVLKLVYTCERSWKVKFFFACPIV